MTHTALLKRVLTTAFLLFLPVAGNMAMAASEVEIPGTFSYSIDENSLVFEMLCFYPTDRQFAPIQRLRKKYRDGSYDAWFCFKHDQLEKNKAAFGIPANAKPIEGYCSYEGKATVVVSNYKVSMDLSGEDTATLKKIISKEPARRTLCPTE